MVNVAFLTTDFSPGTNPPLPGGCAYYRCFLPMQSIAQGGFEARLGYPAFTGEDGFGIGIEPRKGLFGFDVVFLKLLMSRNIPHQMRLARKLGQVLVVDVDDFYADLPESNLAFKATDPRNNRFHNRAVYEEVISEADVVTVTTPFLYEFYSQRHPRVVMIRNGVLPDQFQYRKPVNRKPVIGWVGGVPWRGGDLELLREWLPAFLEEHDLMFHHSGHATRVPGQDDVPSLANIVGIPAERYTHSPLRPMDDYHTMFTFDIGIAPLNDIPFNRAKSNLKGLEYACAGVPFVASGLPEYRRLVESGVGRVADTAGEWRQQLTELLDYRTRKREAAENRRIVTNQWSIMARESEWLDLMKALVDCRENRQGASASSPSLQLT